MKRILLFLTVNFLVVITVSIILSFFQLPKGDYTSLLIFCAAWGMAGALISLALSRKMAKMMMRIKVIDPKTTHPQESRLIECVHELCRSAGMQYMPEVGLYNSPEVNAFATGPSEKRSLVAVSHGLMQQMNKDELEGVLAHEVTHIVNGDMVTMALLQGVINVFVMFLARILAIALTRGNGRRRGSFASYYLFTILFEIVFMILGSMVVAAYSRWREFRADSGGADLAGRQKMISALESLQSHQAQDPRFTSESIKSMKISNFSKKGLLRLFATHPPLSVRIQRLKDI